MLYLVIVFDLSMCSVLHNVRLLVDVGGVLKTCFHFAHKKICFHVFE